MAAYGAGDYGKVKFADENGGESEWMWVRVGYCAEENRGLFGRLDSRPVVLASKLRLGQEVAVSFANVREHRKPQDF